MAPGILARLEDDHFAFLVKSSEITEDKIKKLKKQCFQEGDKNMPFFITTGIYNIVDYNDMVQTMLDKAKLAENSISTEYGQSYAVWTEEMSQKYREQRALISELDKGLELGEFITYYQPIFEKEGLISKLDNFMINSVIDFNMNRIKQGKKIVPCAVNLSRVDFYDVRLLEVLKEKIGKQHNVKDMLKLEVTESAYAVLESDAIDFLRSVNCDMIQGYYFYKPMTSQEFEKCFSK